MEAEEEDEKAEPRAEHSESLWLPRARMQGPDLAHIQHILSDDVCTPVPNSQYTDEQRLSTRGTKHAAKYESKGHRLVQTSILEIVVISKILQVKLTWLKQ